MGPVREGGGGYQNKERVANFAQRNIRGQPKRNLIRGGREKPTRKRGSAGGETTASMARKDEGNRLRDFRSA